ncbi:hypothetical protein E8E13_007987 [Curvularia kusanoi]|uniref:Uncharacterized protein n=1 Tax=Curvularia kusanoi TaxID=90978 RepID=A0A9P4TJZ7_CURKU|nr:hypothetical protein E8E13_007987 [Curvularia kusanoi]
MDSCLIEVEQPLRAVAAASLDAPAEEQHSKGNKSHANTPRQANHIQTAQRSLIFLSPYDAANLTSPKQTVTTTRRRYSEPSRTAVMATVPNADGVGHLAAFEGFLAERDMMRIDTDYESPIHPLYSAATDPGDVEEEHKDPEDFERQSL